MRESQKGAQESSQPPQVRPRQLPNSLAAYADPTVGRMDDAHKIVKAILSLKPEFSIAEVASRYPYKTKELLNRYVNAVRRAGLPE